MAHKRSKSVYCPRCGEQSYVVANLDTGKIESVLVTPKCKFPALCPEEFVRGVFDRQFGARIIVPKTGAMEK